jgi:hypothetical protein
MTVSEMTIAPVIPDQITKHKVIGTAVRMGLVRVYQDMATPTYRPHLREVTPATTDWYCVQFQLQQAWRDLLLCAQERGHRLTKENVDALHADAHVQPFSWPFAHDLGVVVGKDSHHRHFVGINARLGGLPMQVGIHDTLLTGNRTPRLTIFRPTGADPLLLWLLSGVRHRPNAAADRVEVTQPHTLQMLTWLITDAVLEDGCSELYPSSQDQPDTRWKMSAIVRLY